MEDANLAELSTHYSGGEERGGLVTGRGLLGFTGTTELILGSLPAAPALVADIGGGSRRYALWLAGLGYRVEQRDLMPLHVRHSSRTPAVSPGFRRAVGDACDLDLGDACVGAVLLLGPLYHLRRRADWLRALAEARRVVRPGVLVFVGAISRWALHRLTAPVHRADQHRPCGQILIEDEDA